MGSKPIKSGSRNHRRARQAEIHKKLEMSQPVWQTIYKVIDALAPLIIDPDSTYVLRELLDIDPNERDDDGNLKPAKIKSEIQIRGKDLNAEQVGRILASWRLHAQKRIVGYTQEELARLTPDVVKLNAEKNLQKDFQRAMGEEGMIRLKDFMEEQFHGVWVPWDIVEATWVSLYGADDNLKAMRDYLAPNWPDPPIEEVEQIIDPSAHISFDNPTPPVEISKAVIDYEDNPSQNEKFTE